MKRIVLVLACLVLPGTVQAQDAKDKPILVLDAGGHTASVHKVLFTPDGKELITVSNDKTIRIWDAATGEVLRVLRPPIGIGSEGKLYAAALSPDGKTLAVGGFTTDDRRVVNIYQISLATGSLERILRGHVNSIAALAFSPDGKRLASGSGDKTARLWNIATGDCEQSLEGHTKGIYGVAFSPDGQQLATASYDKTGRIWSVKTGASEALLRGHDKEVRCVAWSPDGKTIATASEDYSIRLWDTDGTARRTFDKLGNEIASVTFTADSRQLLFTRGGAGSPDGGFMLDLATGEERVRFMRHTTGVAHGTLSPDGKLAATSGGADNEIYLWKTADATMTLRLVSKGRGVWSAAWSRDGHAIAWGNRYEGSPLELNTPLERSFRLSDLEAGKTPDNSFRRAQPTHGGVSLEAIGRPIVAVRRGGETTAELQLSKENEEVCCFTLLPDDRAAVGANFGLYLFDTRTGKRLREFQGHTGVVLTVAPSPDNRYLLSASDDQTLRLWTLDRDEPLLSLFFPGDDWIAWTPEGYYAASPGGEHLMGWHVNNGKEQMASFYPAAQFRKTMYRPDVIKLLLKTGSVERALEEADKARGKKTEKTEVAKVLPPKAAIVSPVKSGLQQNKAELEVKVSAQSVGELPITSVSLLLDGRAYQGRDGVRSYSPGKSGSVTETWTVTLSPGKHRLQVQADSTVSRGLSDEIEITYAGGTIDKTLPNLYILSVGVADYAKDDLKLNYSATDARAVEQAFKAHGKPLFRGIESKLLTDKQATRTEVLKSLGWLRKQATQADYVVIFFSGHGARDNRGNFFLLPADVDPDDLPATGIADTDLKRALEGMPCKVLVLLDACHSGALGGDKRKAALTDDLIRDLTSDDYGVVLFCSSTGREFSLESNMHRMSYFTFALVEGLAGKQKNAEGIVYLHHLKAHVLDRVKELTKGQQHPVSNDLTQVRSFPLTKP